MSKPTYNPFADKRDNSVWLTITDDDDEQEVEEPKRNTGLSVSYYRVDITDPTSEDIEPYIAECNDLIEALNMTYAEANVFKAIWRKCAARELGIKKTGNEQIYDAEKCVFFSDRILVTDKRRK